MSLFLLENSSIHQQTTFTATLLFILQSVFIYNQLMSTKKQISSLCNICSVYEEIREVLFDETGLDSYIYHNILDISRSHNRIVWVSKGSNKKSFAFKLFHSCDSKLQQGFILKEEVSISKEEIESTRQFGWTSQSLWSSQQSIANSITQA